LMAVMRSEMSFTGVPLFAERRRRGCLRAVTNSAAPERNAYRAVGRQGSFPGWRESRVGEADASRSCRERKVPAPTEALPPGCGRTKRRNLTAIAEAVAWHRHQ
jgi:hypothetical protein